MATSGEGFELVHTFAGLPKTTRGRSINIHIDPKGKNILYCNGNSVFIRDIAEPINCDVYSQHAKNTTVAAYAPSGFYICSADEAGKTRIWDTVNKEHILKYEYTSLGGAIKDIAWTEDSKRIAVCGEGKEVCAHAFMWDTGTSVGTLNGPTKSCNSVAIKQDRPYRLALGSEDFSTFYFEGPPFKFKHQNFDHTNFVNCVRFSHDGTKLATSGADGRCHVYDGKTGEKVGEINEAMGKIHKGGVYGIAWSPDDKFLLTVSADKTVKVWSLGEKDFSSNKEKISWTVGTAVPDMQVGCNWIGNHIFSVSLSGFINLWDVEKPAGAVKVIKGHNKAIHCSTISEDRCTLYTASFEGRICYWNIATGVAEVVEGTAHTNAVQSMSIAGDTMVTCGMDDTVRFVDTKTGKYGAEVLKMDSQPQGVSAGIAGVAVVACLNQLVLIKNRAVVTQLKVNFEATCVDIKPDGTKAAVGGSDGKIHVFVLGVADLKETDKCAVNGKVTDIKFSPDGLTLACCTDKKQVKIVDANDLTIEKGNFASHATKVNRIAWTPDSLYLSSCGIDGVVFTWNATLNERGRRIQGAHSQSCDVTSVQWSSNNQLLTTGRQDCSIRIWNITH